MVVGTVEAEVSLARMGVPIVRNVVPQKNNPFFWELPKLIFTLFILGAKKSEKVAQKCVRTCLGTGNLDNTHKRIFFWDVIL